MMLESSIEAILDVGMMYFEESTNNTPPQITAMAQTIILAFLQKRISFEEASMQMISIVGNASCIEKINTIMNVPEEPIPTQQVIADNPLRQKSRPWTTTEDLRLLAGIYKFGLESWNPIALFVGNGRTRSQCSQRWVRGLNPKISKCAWNTEEEKRLMQLVALYGDKSWTKISAELGNRSDVQCRYRYQQLIKDGNHQQQVQIPTIPDSQKKKKKGFEDYNPHFQQMMQKMGPVNQPVPPQAMQMIQQQMQNQQMQQINQMMMNSMGSQQIPQFSIPYPPQQQSSNQPKDTSQQQIMQMSKMQHQIKKKQTLKKQKNPSSMPHTHQQIIPKNKELKQIKEEKSPEIILNQASSSNWFPDESRNIDDDSSQVVSLHI